MTVFLKNFLIFLFVLLVLFLFYSYFIEPNFLVIKKQTIVLDEKDSNLLSPIKIVHLSDFHCQKFSRREKSLIEKVNVIKPDFIFITGDFLDDSSNIESCQLFFKSLAKNQLIFGVFGNWDHLLPQIPISVLKERLESIGINILVNEIKNIDFGNFDFTIAGIDDPFLGFDDLEKTLQDVEPGKLTFLLSHSPDIIEYSKENIEFLKEKDVDFIFAGHTHGGQVLFLRNFILNLGGKKKYISGLYNIDGLSLYVNQGIGTTIIPFRLGVFPEITIFEFEKNQFND